MEFIYDCLVVARTYYGAFYFKVHTIGYCFRFTSYCGGLSGKIRSTNNRFKTTFRSFTVKAREGMHERRQSQADWCAGAGYEITNSVEAESRDWKHPIQSRWGRYLTYTGDLPSNYP